MKLDIIYEDDFLVAVNKPPRMASVPAEGIALQHTVLGKMQPAYVLHRLDFETSGVMLLGKHERDRAVLESIVGDAQTRKKYVALVRGVPHGRVITKKLAARQVARAGSEKIPAQTTYRVVHVFKAPAPLCSLVEAEIKTGRKHQIRQHFMMVGHPVILDSRYGDVHFNRKFRIKFRLGRQFLHAASISFFHPILKKNMTIEAPLPPDLNVVLKRLQ